jgi:hypothetical protein
VVTREVGRQRECVVVGADAVQVNEAVVLVVRRAASVGDAAASVGTLGRGLRGTSAEGVLLVAFGNGYSHVLLKALRSTVGVLAEAQHVVPTVECSHAHLDRDFLALDPFGSDASSLAAILAISVSLPVRLRIRSKPMAVDGLCTRQRVGDVSVALDGSGERSEGEGDELHGCQLGVNVGVRDLRGSDMYFVRKLERIRKKGEL